MLFRNRVVRSLLAILFVFSVVFCQSWLCFGLSAKSYDYLARDLVRPDQITYDDAKQKGHARSVPSLEDEYTFVFENLDGTYTSYSYNTKVQTKDNIGKWSIFACFDLLAFS